jgi:ankyrin repeat protein
VALSLLALSAGFFFAACEAEIDPNDPQSIRKFYDERVMTNEKGEEIKIPINDILITQIAKGNLDTVGYIITGYGADIVNTPNSKGYTPLIIAADKHNIPMIKLLLEKGAKLDQRIKFGNGQIDALEYLAPKVDTDSSATSPLKQTMKTLIEAIKAADPSGKMFGTALITAATYGNLPTVKLMVENGVPLELQDGAGMTALIAAGKEGREFVVEYLIKQGASLTAVDGQGYNAYDWSAAQGTQNGKELPFPKVAKIFKKAGAKHSAAYKKAF